MKIVITADTYFKAQPLQSSELKAQNLPDQLISVRAGEELDITSYTPYYGIPEVDTDDHIIVQLKQPIKGYKDLRWFVYGLHARVEGAEQGNNPKEQPDDYSSAGASSSIASQKSDRRKDYGPTVSIPGINRPVGIYEPVYFEPQPSNFSWAELTKGGQRIPVDATVTQRIVQLCQYMDEVRAFLGNHPIRITSGYRDPVSNRQVGGARLSRHQYGDAMDFYIEGVDVVDTFYKLKDYHTQGGLAVGNGFVHLDLRPGAPARWTYPGGPQVALW